MNIQKIAEQHMMQKASGINIVILIFLTLFFVDSANAVTVKDYKKFIKSKDIEVQKIIKTHIHGIGVGISWSNSTLLQENPDNALYCEPRAIIFDDENYIQILEDTITKFSKNTTEIKVEELPVGLLLLLGLRDTFPCPKSDKKGE